MQGPGIWAVTALSAAHPGNALKVSLQAGWHWPLVLMSSILTVGTCNAITCCLPRVSCRDQTEDMLLRGNLTGVRAPRRAGIRRFLESMVFCIYMGEMRIIKFVWHVE